MKGARPAVSGGGTTFSTTDGYSGNWSGFVASSSTNYTYETASGEYYVPTVAATDANTNTGDAAMWVGLDGYSDSVVLQDGTDSEVIYYSGGGYYYTYYFMWDEYYPAGYSVLTTSISPNDDVYCQAQTNNSTTAYAALVYWCEDETTGHAYSGTTYNPNYTTYPFEGNSVEWIIEKAYPNMADFGSAYMWGPYGAYTSTGDWFNYSQVNNIQLDITSNGLSTGTVLDTAYPPSPGSWSIDWSWSAYN